MVEEQKWSSPLQLCVGDLSSLLAFRFVVLRLPIGRRCSQIRYRKNSNNWPMCQTVKLRYVLPSDQHENQAYKSH